MEARQYGGGGTKASSTFTQKARKIHILTNGAKSVSSYKFHIYYDLVKSALMVNARTFKKMYKCELPLKLKLYIWYTLTVTWDELDGLRVYVNNRLLDHNIGVKVGFVEKQDEGRSAH